MTRTTGIKEYSDSDTDNEYDDRVYTIRDNPLIREAKKEFSTNEVRIVGEDHTICEHLIICMNIRQFFWYHELYDFMYKHKLILNSMSSDKTGLILSFELFYNMRDWNRFFKTQKATAKMRNKRRK